jgi:two-component system, sensor histidine kinase LadS
MPLLKLFTLVYDNATLFTRGWLGLGCVLLGLVWGGHARADEPAQATASTTVVETPGERPVIVLNEDLAKLASGIDVSYASDYWIDENGLAGIEQASSAAYTSMQPGQVFNIHHKALWISFDVRSSSLDSHWYLTLDSSTVDSITLFWRGVDGQWKSEQAGDYVRRSQWPLPDRQPTFFLKHSGQTTTYYARIQHQRIKFSTPLRLYSQKDYIGERLASTLAIGGYFGLVILALFMGLFVHATMRSRDTKPFIVYVLSLSFSQAALLGLAQQYLWPNAPYWSDQCTFTLGSLTTATGLWFLRSIVQPLRHAPRVDIALLVSILLQVLIAVVDLVHPTLLGVQVITVLMVVQTVLTAVLVYMGHHSADAGVRWISWAYIPVVLAVVPLLLRNMGVIATSFIAQYGVIFGSAIGMPMLLYGLFRHTAGRREAKERATGLSMKDALTGTSNMRELLHTMHGTMKRAAHLEQSYGMILVDLSNYDALKDLHGQEIADRALVLLGTRLQMIVNEVDTVARIGGEQFVVLLEGPCKAANITKMAARITASGYTASDLLPVGTTLKLRVTCALLPSAETHDIDDAPGQLDWLISSSQLMPESSTQTMRTLNF